MTVCAHNPPRLSVAIYQKENGDLKNTLRNIQKTGHFVLNAVNKTPLPKAIPCAKTLPPDCSEFDAFNIQHIFYKEDIPHVSKSPFTLYCKAIEQIHIGKENKGSTLVLAQMSRFYLKNNALNSLTKPELIGHFGINVIISKKLYRDE